MIFARYSNFCPLKMYKFWYKSTNQRPYFQTCLIGLVQVQVLLNQPIYDTIFTSYSDLYPFCSKGVPFLVRIYKSMSMFSNMLNQHIYGTIFGSYSNFVKLSQKSKLKLRLLAEMVIFSFNPPMHPPGQV